MGRSEIDALHGSHRGTVRVGINETVAREFFAAFLASFRTEHPNVRFEITVANSDQLEEILLRGEIDILIGYAVWDLDQISGRRYSLASAVELSRVVVTDTLPIAPERRIDKLAVLSVSKLIADAIDAVFEDTSVSEIFGGDNLA